MHQYHVGTLGRFQWGGELEWRSRLRKKHGPNKERV